MKYMSEFDESRPSETLYDDERHQRVSQRVHFCSSALQGPASRFLPLPESSSKNRALKRPASKSTELVSAKRRRFQPSSCKSAQISRQSTGTGNSPSEAMCTDESPDGHMMDCDDDDNNYNNNNNSTSSKQEKRCTRAVRRCTRDDSSSEFDDSDASRSRSALSRGASRSRQTTRRLKGILKRSKRRRRRRGKKCRRRVRFNKKVMVRRFVKC